jgi:UDP-2,4-diacetamido-2,4,6-trideoxy-beta-L-altropyranose hydrolase
MKVFFRVDANPKIGLGHITRCIALAHMLKIEHEIHFICKELPEKILNQLSNCNFVLHMIDYDTLISNFICANDIVVLDGYQFNSDYQKFIKNIGSKLICIDDLYTQEFFADLIINHAPGVSDLNYNVQLYTQFALGINYALLRPLFLKQATLNRTIKKIETIIVCFGGSDNMNLTEKILNILVKQKMYKKIILVTGELYSYLNHLKSIIQKIPQIEHYHNISEKKMLSLMLQSEVAIVPSSSLVFEALAAGCRVITGYYVNNQFEIYKGFKKLNVIIGAENFNEFEVLNALKLVNEFKPAKVINGESQSNILQKIQSIVNVHSNIN